jgi:hypothetical protein
MDIKLFSDKISIACNYLPFHKDFKYLNCPYVVNSAPYFLSPVGGKYARDFRELLNKIAVKYKKIIIENPEKYFFTHLSSYPFIRKKNIFYLFKNIPDKRLSENFISNNLDCLAGVFRTSIMLALYMGFEDITLIGCDYTHNPRLKKHWYEKGLGEVIDWPDFEKQLVEYLSKNIKVKTVTLNGMANGIEACDYRLISGGVDIYQENTILADKEILNILSSYRGYKIY